MSIQGVLERIRGYLTNNAEKRPSNEPNTCGWVIRPLLYQCGYDYHDIDEQAHDGAGNIPDFTLLPDTEHMWFLEAKAWQAKLTDAHVIQAMNYAHTKG